VQGRDDVEGRTRRLFTPRWHRNDVWRVEGFDRARDTADADQDDAARACARRRCRGGAVQGWDDVEGWTRRVLAPRRCRLDVSAGGNARGWQIFHRLGNGTAAVSELSPGPHARGLIAAIAAGGTADCALQGW
jgi:hypothetical protein